MSFRSVVCCGLAVAVVAVVHAETRTISQKGRAFSASELTIKPGDTVVFKNDDDITHNVFSATTGMEFNLKVQAPGGSAEHTFKNEGVAELRCAFHPKMKLSITVKK